MRMNPYRCSLTRHISQLQTFLVGRSAKKIDVRTIVRVKNAVLPERTLIQGINSQIEDSYEDE